MLYQHIGVWQAGARKRAQTKLKAEQIQAQVRRYIDKHGWDVAAEEELWRKYQQARVAKEYRADDWRPSSL
ncbi:MAG TPA: hypothetical protein VOA87_13135 [Thermoanaerobaculia bacterium]|nr:hypothetical protein [Thermoanaerobaculia bacterium]